MTKLNSILLTAAMAIAAAPLALAADDDFTINLDINVTQMPSQVQVARVACLISCKIPIQENYDNTPQIYMPALTNLLEVLDNDDQQKSRLEALAMEDVAQILLKELPINPATGQLVTTFQFTMGAELVPDPNSNIGKKYPDDVKHYTCGIRFANFGLNPAVDPEIQNDGTQGGGEVFPIDAFSQINQFDEPLVGIYFVSGAFQNLAANDQNCNDP